MHKSGTHLAEITFPFQAWMSQGALPSDPDLLGDAISPSHSLLHPHQQDLMALPSVCHQQLRV